MLGNRFEFLGTLVTEPELVKLSGDKTLVKLRLAIPSYGERSEFVTVTLWDKLAETAVQYLSKGRQILVEGRLKEDRWEDKETSAPRRDWEFVVENFKFIGKGKKDD